MHFTGTTVLRVKDGKIAEEIGLDDGVTALAGNPPIEARVGVNTGEVVVRSIATGDGHVEYTPIGHSTSLAARMQVLAPTGSIAATEQVGKICEGYFVFKDLGPTSVKGVAGQINVFGLESAAPPGGSARTDTRASRGPPAWLVAAHAKNLRPS